MTSRRSADRQIVVLGSINMDLVARCCTLPVAGQTLSATDFFEVPGGKGANQAVAAQRAGGNVTMIGGVGDDGFGSRLLHGLRHERIHCDHINVAGRTPSGLAMIVVSDSGENQIVVVPGANAQVGPEDVERCAEVIRTAAILLVQLEIPPATVFHAVDMAHSAGVRVILDPAPVPESGMRQDLRGIDLICPNETEAAALTGCPVDSQSGLEQAARQLHDRGAKNVAITLGGSGTLLWDGENFATIGAIPVDAVDSTAAGDAFAGATAVHWLESDSLMKAVRFGNAAGALAASKQGAQPAMGTRADIEQLLQRQA